MKDEPGILLTSFLMFIANLKDFKHFLAALITTYVLLFMPCFPYILDKILKKAKKDDLKNEKKNSVE